MISIQQQQAGLGYQDFTTCSAAARASSAAATAAVGPAPRGFASHLQQLLLGGQPSAESSGMTGTAVASDGVGSPSDHYQHLNSLSSNSTAAGLSTTSSAAAAAGAPQSTTVCAAASHPSSQPLLQQPQQQGISVTSYGLPSGCGQQQGPAGVVSTGASTDRDQACLQTPAGDLSRSGSTGSAGTAAGMCAGLRRSGSSPATNQQPQLQLQLLLAQQQLQLSSSHAALQQQQQMQLLMLQGEPQRQQQQQQLQRRRQLVLMSAENATPGEAATKQLVLAPPTLEPFPAPLTSTAALQDPTFSAGFAAGMLQGIAHFAKLVPSAATGLSAATLPPACAGPAAAAATGTAVQKAQLQAELQARQQQFHLQKSLRGQLQQQAHHPKGVTKKVGGSSSRSIHAASSGMPPPRQRKRCLEASTAGGGATRTCSQTAAAAAARSSPVPASADTTVALAAAAAAAVAPAGGFIPPASSVAVCCSISDLLGTSATEEAAVLLASMSRAELFQFAAKAVGGCCAWEQLSSAEQCVNESCQAAAHAAGVSCRSGPGSSDCGPAAAAGCCAPMCMPGSSSPSTACTTQGGSYTAGRAASGAQADTSAAQLAAAGGPDAAAQPGVRQQLGSVGQAPGASILPAGTSAQSAAWCCQPVKNSVAGGAAAAAGAPTGRAAEADSIPTASASMCETFPVSTGAMAGGDITAPSICTPEEMGDGCCSVDDIVAGRCILADASQPPPPHQQQQQPSSATVPCCTPEQMLAGCCSAADIAEGRCILMEPSSALLTNPPAAAGCCLPFQTDRQPGSMLAPPGSGNMLSCLDNAGTACSDATAYITMRRYCTPAQLEAGCCSPEQVVSGSCILVETEELAEQLSAMLRCNSDSTAPAPASVPMPAASAVLTGTVPQFLRAVGVEPAAGAGTQSYKELYMEWQQDEGVDGMDWAAQGLFGAI